MNVFPCKAENGQYYLEGGRSGNRNDVSASVTQLGIRPEHLSLGEPGDGQCDGLVEVVEYLGADTFVVLDCAPLGLISVRVAGETTLMPGDTASLFLNPRRIVFFDATGEAVYGS